MNNAKYWKIFEQFAGCSRKFAELSVRDSQIVISQRTINGNFVLQASPVYWTWRLIVDGKVEKGGRL